MKKLKPLLCFNWMTASGPRLFSQLRRSCELPAPGEQPRTQLTFMVMVLNSDDSALGRSGIFKYCLLIQRLYSEGINHTDEDFFWRNGMKQFATWIWSTQGNARGTGSPCDLSEQLWNKLSMLTPGICTYGLSTTEPRQPSFFGTFSSCTSWDSSIHPLHRQNSRQKSLGKRLKATRSDPSQRAPVSKTVI